MPDKHILERLADACVAGEGITLTASEVYDILAEFDEADLSHSLDVALLERELIEAEGDDTAIN